MLVQVAHTLFNISVQSATSSPVFFYNEPTTLSGQPNATGLADGVRLLSGDGSGIHASIWVQFTINLRFLSKTPAYPIINPTLKRNHVLHPLLLAHYIVHTNDFELLYSQSDQFLVSYSFGRIPSRKLNTHDRSNLKKSDNQHTSLVPVLLVSCLMYVLNFVFAIHLVRTPALFFIHACKPCRFINIYMGFISKTSLTTQSPIKISSTLLHQFFRLLV